MSLKSANIIGMMTMDNYEEASDFTIDKMVAEALGVYYDTESVCTVWIEADSEIERGEKCIRIFTPTTDPSDAWPIIVENLIQIMPKDDSYLGLPCARDYSGEYISYADDNNKLLRAAMVVFLMMKGDANE